MYPMPQVRGGLPQAFAAYIKDSLLSLKRKKQRNFTAWLAARGHGESQECMQKRADMPAVKRKKQRNFTAWFAACGHGESQECMQNRANMACCEQGEAEEFHGLACRPRKWEGKRAHVEKCWHGAKEIGKTSFAFPFLRAGRRARGAEGKTSA